MSRFIYRNTLSQREFHRYMMRCSGRLSNVPVGLRLPLNKRPSFTAFYVSPWKDTIWRAEQ